VVQEKLHNYTKEVGERLKMVKEEFGESIDVGHLLRAAVVYSRLNVVVASNSSWAWYIACSQVGLSRITCVPLADIAKKHLEQFGQAGLSLLDSSNEVALSEASGMVCDVLLVEVVGDDRSWLSLTENAKRIVVIGPIIVRSALQERMKWVTWQGKVTHRKLGGLTKAATVVIWGGGCGDRWRLRDACYPKRPTNRFVEVASDLPRGSVRRDLQHQELWWSAATDEPFRWPFVR
jgi:hypothetical protein